MSRRGTSRQTQPRETWALTKTCRPKGSEPIFWRASLGARQLPVRILGRTRHECRGMAHSGLRSRGRKRSLAGVALRPFTQTPLPYLSQTRCREEHSIEQHPSQEAEQPKLQRRGNRHGCWGGGGGRRATWETRGEVYGGRAQWAGLGYRPPLPGLQYPLPHFPTAVDTWFCSLSLGPRL